MLPIKDKPTDTPHVFQMSYYIYYQAGISSFKQDDIKGPAVAVD